MSHETHKQIILERARLQKLDPTFKAAWLANLRSGQFIQTRGALHRLERETLVTSGQVVNAGHCCLGIAYEAADIIGFCPIRRKSRGGLEVYGPEDGTNFYDTFPSELFLEKIGLALPVAEYLAELNDTGTSFLEIASLIEDTL